MSTRWRATAPSGSAWPKLGDLARRLGVLAGGAGRVALDLLLPPHCLTCDAPVPENGRFCAECFAATAFLSEPCCAACGVPVARSGGRLCHACLVAPPPWQRARAALRYDAQARRVVLPLKYADRIDLAGPIAAMMARAGAALLRDAELLVPVPLHRRRLLARRYNQAALLARALGRVAGKAVAVDALIRVRPTVSLGQLSSADRARQVSGAFAVRTVRAAALAGTRVLLIDDVLTSGATAGACTEILLDAGVRAVDVLVAARVPHPGGSLEET